MQSLFLEPARSGKLAKCAVCFILALLTSSLLALGIAGAAVWLPVPDKLKVPIALLPFALWACWLLQGALKSVQLLKHATSLDASAKEFQSIQYASILLFLFSAVCYSRGLFSDVDQWTITIQIFLLLFYVVFFVFGLLARVKLSTSSWINFALLLASLFLSIKSVARDMVSQ
jgi:hypothetical protein